MIKGIDMIATQQKNVPTLRFPEFSGEWTNKKIRYIAPLQRGFDLPTTQVSKGKYPVAYSNGVLRTHSEYKVVGPGVVTGRSGTIGKVTFIEEKYWPHNTSLWVTDFCGNDPKYIYYFYSQIRLERYNAGSTVPTLNRNDVHSLKRYIPHFKEQQKIAAFLSSADTKIEQLGKKKALLEQYKKGMMQKLFSQEIRFKDNSGSDYPEWGEKTFGDICNVKRGASPRPITSPKWFSDYSNIGWVRISDVTSSNKYLTETAQYLSGEGVRKSRFIPKGNIIMSICATIGKPIYTNFDVCIHDGFVVFEGLRVNKEFIYYFLEKVQRRWYRYGQPGTQVNLNSDIVSNEIIKVPAEAEQQKITIFLSAIDRKIELVATQLDQARAFKKGLLQQMFI